MARPRRGDFERRPSIVAWFGLLVMAASFVWLQIIPTNDPRNVSAPPVARPREQLALVVIDPGHGGQDSGTMGSGLLEKDLAFDVAQRLDRLIQNQGLATLLTRAGDEYISLAGRAAAANRQRDCIFVSIHFDEARAAATGVETYYAATETPNQPMVATWLPFLQPASVAQANVQSQSLAAFVEEALVAKTHAINRGTSPEQFYVITNVRHPAVLIECGFLTNTDDVAKLRTPEYREQLAAAICEGIARYRETLCQTQPAIAGTAPET